MSSRPSDVESQGNASDFVLSFNNSKEGDVVDFCVPCFDIYQVREVASHFCFDCGQRGRYLCSKCIRHHQSYTKGHNLQLLSDTREVEKQKEACDIQCKMLNQWVQHLRNENKRLSDERNELHQQCALSFDQEKKLNLHLTKVQTEMKELLLRDDNISRLKKENEHLQIELKQSQKNVEEKERNNIYWVLKIIDIQEEMEKLKDGLNVERRMLNQRVQRLNNENKELSNKIHELHQQCALSFDREKKLKLHLTDVETEKKELLLRDDNISRLKKENEHLQIELKQSQKNVEEKERNNIYWVLKIIDIQEEMEKLKDGLNVERRMLNQRVQKLYNENKGLSDKIHELHQQCALSCDREKKLKLHLTDVETEKKDFLLRMSKVASANLVFNNPNIADLSDANRPTKLAEKFSELFENQWAVAFEAIHSENEKQTILMLLTLLESVNELCYKLVNHHKENIETSFMSIAVEYPLSSTQDSKIQQLDALMYTKTQQKALREQANCWRTWMQESVNTTMQELDNDEHKAGDNAISIPNLDKTNNCKRDDTILSREQLTYHNTIFNKEDKSSGTLDKAVQVQLQDRNNVATWTSPPYHIETDTKFDEFSKEQKKTVQDMSKIAEFHFTRDTVDLITKLVSSSSRICQDQYVRKYINDSAEICWSMQLHHPPVHIDFVKETNQPFNNIAYRPYTKTGQRLDYMVWPSLYLHKDGPMLSKGVAQGV